MPNKITILEGHVLDKLKELPNDSVHCCVTSPPYWGLRQYDTAHQIWGGSAPCQHIWKEGGGGLLHENRNFKRGAQEAVSGSGPLVRVKDESKGGDFICTECGAWRGELGGEPTIDLYVEHLVEVFREVRRVLHPSGVVFLNLGDSYAGSNRGVMADGSQVGGPKQQTSRGSVTGLKKTPPQDGLKPKDLCGVPWRVALALQADGWWLRSDIVWNKTNPMPESMRDRPTRTHEYIFLLAKSITYYWDAEAIKEEGIIPAGTLAAKGSVERYNMPLVSSRPPEYKEYTGMRNVRTVWTFPTAHGGGFHFATFPVELVERCIKAGTRETVCACCGSPFKCKCPTATGVKPSTVLDPFGGSGTTALVASQLGRDAILVELNADYVKKAQDRIEREQTYAIGIGSVVIEGVQLKKRGLIF